MCVGLGRLLTRCSYYYHVIAHDDFRRITAYHLLKTKIWQIFCFGDIQLMLDIYSSCIVFSQLSFLKFVFL